MHGRHSIQITALFYVLNPMCAIQMHLHVVDNHNCVHVTIHLRQKKPTVISSITVIDKAKGLRRDYMQLDTHRVLCCQMLLLQPLLQYAALNLRPSVNLCSKLHSQMLTTTANVLCSMAAGRA